MEKRGEKLLCRGGLMLALFVVWTWLVQSVDVRPAGVLGTDIGFAEINVRFHEMTGVHMWLYIATDWLGLVPVFVCLLFGLVGVVQLVKRKSLRKVDRDIILLGLYYLLVVVCYLTFERFPVNYRPILIEGRMEASYPSSTTLLVLSVMPTLVFKIQRRWNDGKTKRMVSVATVVFTAFMLIGRLLSGVHWLTDIVGSMLLSAGLFCLYTSAVFLLEEEKNG